MTEEEKYIDDFEKQLDLEEENLKITLNKIKKKKRYRNLFIIFCGLLFIGALIAIYINDRAIFKRELEHQRKYGLKGYEEWLETAGEDKNTSTLNNYEKSEEEIPIGKRNAVKTAESYLKYSSFSKKGLREQLEYEGYTKEEVDYAIEIVYK